MQKGRCKEKSDEIRNRKRGCRPFRSMNMAVKEGEGADENHACRKRQSRRPGNEKTHDHHRSQNALLYKRQTDTGGTQYPPKRHDAHKTTGHRPDRASSRLRRPKTDRHHGQNMIEPMPGMTKTRDASRRFAMERVSTRHERKQKQANQKERNFSKEPIRKTHGPSVSKCLAQSRKVGLIFQLSDG